MRWRRLAGSVLLVVTVPVVGLTEPPPAAPTVWTLDNTTRIGGHAVSLRGEPRAVPTTIGAALEFDGVDDGVFVERNPLEGLSRFTVEAIVQPNAGGAEEQRFLHIQEAGTEDRVLMELRQRADGRWWLDSYLRDGDSQLTLIDRGRLHEPGRWYAVALTYDGRTMTHYVDGVRQGSGEVRFSALGAGPTSIGVRQNGVSWFKGLIREVRVTPDALPVDRLQRVPSGLAARGASPPAFGWRCIPAGCVAPPSNTGHILSRRALPAGRLASLGATPDLHHGLLASIARGTGPRVIPLWPEGVPGLRADAGPEQDIDGRVSNVHVPTLTRIDPDGPANGTAVIVCPGGSYARLAMANEADGVAHVLESRGVTTFVLKYRLAEYGHPAPLQDVLRAIRLVRSRAAEWGLLSNRIGVMGASAGGHLAASAATLFDSAEGRTGADLDRVSARPDFVALLYPVISMRPPLAHEPSRRNLLGGSPSAELMDRLSLERHVSPSTPPVFLVHTAEDESVPLEHSLRFVEALRAAGVPTELHLFERGRHGFGTSPGLGTTSSWTDRWIEWMSVHGWLPGYPPTGTAVMSARGVEGQRKADLGNGYYLNPIVAGDHPDPSILKDGDDYYATFSSFDAYPGLVIWHSRDLVNWEVVGPTLFKNVGSVWAPDLVKHDGRYYIYFPGIGPYRSNYVIWSDSVRGPWSDPIDLKIRRIDPGHAVGPDGQRYLFLSAGYVVPLSPDGLSVAGPEKKVYDGWPYPKDWIVEGFAQEGPKLLKRGDYYYMVLAEGGTAGPPTGHMIVSARSKSIEGPWENSPYNPIVRTRSASERWWSKGHGTLVQAPDQSWVIVYHAYENGFYTLGRQMLMEPIEWTSDGWFRTAGADPAQPIAKRGGEAVAHGFAFSDDFSTDRMGTQWSFYKGSVTDRERYRYEDGALVLEARGTSPADSSPLWFVNGDHAYEIEVEIDADPGATAGLLLFYSSRLYAGLGFSSSNFIMHSYGLDRPQARLAAVGRRLFIRIRNNRHIVTMDYSVDGTTWERYDRGMEVSGYHHNVAYEFSSLRPALYAVGSGEVRFRKFKYRALP